MGMGQDMIQPLPRLSAVDFKSACDWLDFFCHDVICFHVHFNKINSGMQFNEIWNELD